MRLLIMSDGTPTGTRVTDEYHKPIEGVTAISWKQEVGQMPVVKITLNTAQVGLMANLPDAEPATEKPNNAKHSKPK
jgi:hypothetical protein